MEFHSFYKTQKKPYCRSVLDIPMADESARELEELLKEAEANGYGYKRYTFANTDAIKKYASDDLPPQYSGSALLTANTAAVDADNEVIQPYGVVLANYRRNPTIVWAHDYTQPPVARSIWERYDKEANAIKARAAFPKSPYSDDVPWLPKTLLALIAADCLKGVSIGALPIIGGPPTQKEIDERPELQSVKNVIRKCVLLEISLCTLGANPDALIESVDMGSVEKSQLLSLGFDLQAEDPWDWTAAPIIKQEPNKLDILKTAFRITR